MLKENIWLIGTGAMAIEYAKVLNKLECSYIVIGRGKENCEKFETTAGIKPCVGGLSAYLETKPALPSAAIVAVGIEALAEITLQLLDFGVKYILLEKPGVGYPAEIESLSSAAREKNSTILLAYNRRFYASVTKAKQMIDEDGGAVSCFFEFTEWSHVISTLPKHAAEHQNWFLGNSTHVVDTAFYLCGKPAELCSYTGGGLQWHTASSVFAGAGKTEKEVLFSYMANWEAPGRWVLEVMTRKRRLIFKPMEKLQVMKIGSVAVDFVEDVDYSNDEQFKPGLYLQTQTFLNKNTDDFCSIQEQQEMIGKFYLKMSNYTI